ILFLSCLFLFHSYSAARYSHSFPTRRSSDLAQVEQVLLDASANVERIHRSFDLPARIEQRRIPRRRGEVDAERRGIERPSSFLRSEEHTSELQSHLNLVCRLLLEKKK